MTTTTNNPTPNTFRKDRPKNQKGDKKVWRFLDVKPDHEPGTYVCLQELEGDWGVPNENGHNEKGWKPAEEPPVRRVVFMERHDDGSLKNIYPGYNGDKYTIRDS